MTEYVCSKCGKPAYFDGRCGDGPILMCGCDEKGPVFYDGRCGDGPIHMSDARAVLKSEYEQVLTSKKTSKKKTKSVKSPRRVGRR